jgi:hypothetical protein
MAPISRPGDASARSRRHAPGGGGGAHAAGAALPGAGGPLRAGGAGGVPLHDVPTGRPGARGHCSARSSKCSPHGDPCPRVRSLATLRPACSLLERPIPCGRPGRPCSNCALSVLSSNAFTDAVRAGPSRSSSLNPSVVNHFSAYITVWRCPARPESRAAADEEVARLEAAEVLAEAIEVGDHARAAVSDSRARSTRASSWSRRLR